MAYFVYILRCLDGSLYTGVTTDPERRFAQHCGKLKSGAKYTASRRPERFECVWAVGGRSEALKLEYRIKQLERRQKEALIGVHPPEGFELSGCRRLKTTENGRIISMFICYPKCTTCRKAQAFLDEREVKYDFRDIKENNPTEAELREWHAKSGLPLKRFFNTSGLQYKALGLAAKLPSMTEDEQYKLLSTDGMLVKRPIFVGGDFVLVGFKPEEWEKRF